MGSKGPQIFAAFAATIGAFGLGTVLGWTSPAFPDLDSSVNNTNSKFAHKLSDDEKSWIGSIVNLAAMFSGPIAGMCIDAFGRKTTMLLLSAPFIAGWLLVAFAHNFVMMLIGRFIIGFCGGSYSLAIPVYIGETAEDSIRGALGSGFSMMMVIGILFVYIVGAYVDWQILSFICGGVPLVLLATLTFAPESPGYLLSKGKKTEASKALRWLRGAKSIAEIEDELKILEISVNEAVAHKSSMSDLLKPYYFKPILILLGVMLFEQISGFNAVIFYTVEIFQDAGSNIDPHLSTVIIGIVQVLATVATILFVDKLGRRILLIFSEVVMCASLILLGLYFQLKVGNPNVQNQLGWLPLVSLIFFIAAFSIGIGPISWIMMSEMLPPNIKGKAASISVAMVWFSAFIVTKFFEDIKEAVSIQWCYWLFASTCGIGVIYIFIFVPETKGKSMDEIQAHYGGPTKNTINTTEKETF